MGRRDAIPKTPQTLRPSHNDRSRYIHTRPAKENSTEILAGKDNFSRFGAAESRTAPGVRE
jgi:hypothetical protein